MSPEHVNHLLLGLLEEAGKLDSDGLSKFVEVRVFLFDELHELADLTFEVVE